MGSYWLMEEGSLEDCAAHEGGGFQTLQMTVLDYWGNWVDWIFVVVVV